MGCSVLDRDSNAEIIHIIPIVTRTDGVDIAELGAGGGKGDLDQKEELESGGVGGMDKLLELCAASIDDERLLAKVVALVRRTLIEDGKLDLDMQLQKHIHDTQDDVSLETLVSILSSNALQDSGMELPSNKTIRFPYSRHSSYSELRGFVRAFSPRDVFPCTVDDVHWTLELSMRNLFGDLCSADLFRHDTIMMEIFEARLAFEGRQKRYRGENQADTQMTDDGAHERDVILPTSNDLASSTPTKSGSFGVRRVLPTSETPFAHSFRQEVTDQTPEDQSIHFASVAKQHTTASDSSSRIDLLAPSLHKRRRKTNRQLAYDAAIGADGLSWSDYGGLVSTRSRAVQDEPEL
jgi:hypothetical protein